MQKYLLEAFDVLLSIEEPMAEGNFPVLEADRLLSLFDAIENLTSETSEQIQRMNPEGFELEWDKQIRQEVQKILDDWHRYQRDPDGFNYVEPQRPPM